MKKILQIILVLCMLSLTACGGGGNSDSDIGQVKNNDITAVSSQSGITVTEQGITTTTGQGITATADAVSESGENANAGSADTASMIGNSKAGIKGDGTGGSKEDSADAGQKLDKYQTSPVPEGKPDPVEPQNTDIDKKTQYNCTLSITCSTILDNLDKLDQAKLEVLPEDGVIYKTKKVVFYEGESVFDVLLRETRENKIHMEFVSTPIYNSNYIEGINNLYEFDCGELSGWMYRVNDWFPNYGCSRYQLQDGDKIEWVYTCDLGNDVGGEWASQHQKEQ